MPCVDSIEAFLVQAGCTVASARNIAVVAEEIFANISRYAWPDGRGGACTVDVTASVDTASVHVCLRVEDDGIPFDPTRAKAPDLETSLEDRSVGGLGIMLIKRMTDTQSYHRAGARNIFEITRICPRAPFSLPP